MNEPRLNKLTIASAKPTFGAEPVAWHIAVPRSVAEQRNEHQRVNDADHTEQAEGVAPGVPFGEPAPKPPKTGTDHDTAHVHARRQRASGAAMIIGDEGESRGNVAGLADAHERTGDEQLVEGPGLTAEPGNRRPDEETADDDPGFG